MDVIYSNPDKMLTATALLNLRLKAIENAKNLEEENTNKRRRTVEEKKSRRIK
jgi:hypothetical protein